jgi:uncharacterized membrane protein
MAVRLHFLSRVLWLAVYAVVFVLLVGLLAYFGTLAGLSPQGITTAVLVLIVVGVAIAATRLRQRDAH